MASFVRLQTLADRITPERTLIGPLYEAFVGTATSMRFQRPRLIY